MSETNNSDKTLGAAPPKATLHLKRPVEQGIGAPELFAWAQQGGRRREGEAPHLTPGEAPARDAAPPPRRRPPPAPASRFSPAAAKPAPAAPAKAAAPPPPKTGVVLPTLTGRAARGARPGAFDARARRRRIAAGRRRTPGRGANARRASAPNARPPKRASAKKKFAAPRTPISSASRRTRREGVWRRRTGAAPSSRARPRPRPAPAGPRALGRGRRRRGG